MQPKLIACRREEAMPTRKSKAENALLDAMARHSAAAESLIAAWPAARLDEVICADEKERTPLMWALAAGNIPAARMLLGRGASVNARNTHGATALYIVCQYGFHVSAKFLLQCGANVNLVTIKGKSALHQACRQGCGKCVQLLCDAGANLEANGGLRGFLPIHLACYKGALECLQILVAAGAPLDAGATDLCATPMLLACHQGHIDCVHALLEAGAAVDLVDVNGWTPMTRACVGGDAECVKLLSSFGAARSWLLAGAITTAEDITEEEGFEDLTTWLRASTGWTPLHHLEALSVERTRSLLREGALASTVGSADIRARPKTGTDRRTPLERAAALELPTDASRLLQRAALPWSRHTHDLFPTAARAHARAVLRIGHLLAAQPRFGGESQSIVDAWSVVMAHAVTRESVPVQISHSSVRSRRPRPSRRR